MDDESDPRIYFAAEHTLLAWLRTGIAVIGPGFLVARFGVFLMIVRGQTDDFLLRSIDSIARKSETDITARPVSTTMGET